MNQVHKSPVESTTSSGNQIFRFESKKKMFKYFAIATLAMVNAAEESAMTDPFKAFAAPPIAKGTPKICSDDCYPVGTVVQAAFDAAGEEFPEQFQYHGCYCPRLFGNPNFLAYTAQGCEPADELDFLCKDWLRKRRCHTFRNGLCEAENTRTVSYELAVADDQTMSCTAKGIHVSEACGNALCELDLAMANTIRQYIDDNVVEQKSCASQEEGVCGSHGGTGVDTCCVSTLVAFRSDSDYICPDVVE